MFSPDPIKQGTYCGYPKCCIEHYVAAQGAPTPTKAERALGFGGTGYRPCPQCQTRPMAEVWSDIILRRLIPVPFPLEPEDLAEDQPRPRKRVRYAQYRGFVKRLRERVGVAAADDYITSSLARMRDQVAAPRLRERMQAKLAETFVVLKHRPNGIYLVFGPGGFERIQDLFCGESTNWSMKGTRPKAYPSLVWIDDTTEGNGYDWRRTATIRCYVVDDWIVNESQQHPDLAMQVAEAMESVTARMNTMVTLPSQQPSRLPNMEVTPLGYIVRTQAGYHRAMKDYLRQVEIPPNRLLRDMREYGEYPALVTFYLTGPWTLGHAWLDTDGVRKRMHQHSEVLSRLSTP